MFELLCCIEEETNPPSSPNIDVKVGSQHFNLTAIV